MKKNELLALLYRNYTEFCKYIASLSERDYEFAAPEKWSAELQLKHLIISIKPLVYIFNLKTSAIQEKFGSVSEPPRSYEEIKALYFEKLKEGGKAPDRFAPDHQVIPKDKLLDELQHLVQQLGGLIENFSEVALDSLCVPHPLLGNLSFREMSYNAIYHAEHHQQLIVEMLKKSDATHN